VVVAVAGRILLALLVVLAAAVVGLLAQLAVQQRQAKVLQAALAETTLL
jgi:hypothetical protein